MYVCNGVLEDGSASSRESVAKNVISHFHFKTILVRIYSIFHQSYKNQAKLEARFKGLNIIIKIGCVLEPR